MNKVKEYKYVLFDLDGTLTDSALGITNSAAYALKKYGIDIADNNELLKFIGPPLHESFKNFYGFSEDESVQAVKYFREYYNDKGIFENTVYDGIPQLLETLSEAGRTPVVATSKAELFAARIIEHFNLDKYFAYVAGGNMDGTRTRKDEVIEYALKSAGVTDKSAVIMIGDRHHDILGAKKAGIDSIGVLYGYGSREELENAGADFIAPTVSDIEHLLLNTSEK